MASVALVVATAIVAPFALPLDRVAPMPAALVWLGSLGLRAVTVVGGAVALVAYFPRSHLFEALADWCLHEVLPLVASGLGLGEHALAQAATLLPGLALVIPLLWLLVGLIRSWVALRHTLGGSLGSGPAGSTVVRDDSVVVAATELGQRRVVVSDGALRVLDDEELAASLAHERGHLERRHRPILLCGSLFAALAALLPGTRAARRELRFHLERDADEYAVDATRDPLALASAICKAAQATTGGLVGLRGRGHTGRRVAYLVDGRLRSTSRVLELGTRLVLGGLVVLFLLVASATPVVVQTASAGDARAADCHHHHQFH